MKKSTPEKFWSALFGVPCFMLTTPKQIRKKRTQIAEKGMKLVKP